MKDLDLRYVAHRTADGHVCGAPGCGSVYFVDTPTDVGCENGHRVPDWQVPQMYDDADLA